MLLAVACGSAAGPGSARSPAPPPTTTATPSATPAVDPTRLRAEAYVRASTGIFVGGDDHVAVVVQNTGRDIGDLGIAMALKDDWIAQHGMAMGSSPRCELDQALRGFACGSIKSGATAAMVLRATPTYPGTYHYEVAFFDLAEGHQAIQGPQGGDLLASFEETVVALKT